ncbi:hypothetical protein DPMN_108104 [Dreissena polymorpha]|uniref:Uncharacterized protein n=1 Tax=Dreissena polymorpha TaxID=45954 RepID=A0A9D4K897_DREPO|nr:hypothetical protein DPMN_108104 [Dreissena polymorpha]
MWHRDAPNIGYIVSQRCPSYRVQCVNDMFLLSDYTCHRDAFHIRHSVTRRCHSDQVQRDTEMSLLSGIT